MTTERRTAARVRFAGGVLPPAARIHPGRDVIVVDLSRTGALVEGFWRLRPGARVDLQIDVDGNDPIVRGRVERCYVASIDHPGGVRYRTAIRFDTFVAFAPPGDPLVGYSLPAGRRAAAADSGHRLPGNPAGRRELPKHPLKSAAK